MLEPVAESFDPVSPIQIQNAGCGDWDVWLEAPEHRFRVTARQADKKGCSYLGATAYWRDRGGMRGLADGAFTQATWRRILVDIAHVHQGGSEPEAERPAASVPHDPWPGQVGLSMLAIKAKREALAAIEECKPREGANGQDE